MSTIAIQISKDGLSWSCLPDPLSLDGDNEVTEEFQTWPTLPPYNGGGIPRALEERLLTYGIVAEVIEDADLVFMSATGDADRRRVGIAEVAVEAEGCEVKILDAHPDGAVGTIREHAAELVSTTPRPPGM